MSKRYYGKLSDIDYTRPIEIARVVMWFLIAFMFLDFIAYFFLKLISVELAFALALLAGINVMIPLAYLFWASAWCIEVEIEDKQDEDA